TDTRLVRELGLAQLHSEAQPGVLDVVPRPRQGRPEVGRLAPLPGLRLEEVIVAALQRIALARLAQFFFRVVVVGLDHAVPRADVVESLRHYHRLLDEAV